MHKRNLVALLILINASLFAQSFKSSITGTIKDAKTKEHLPNANIFISETTWGTTSDLFGKFELNNLPAGLHEVVVSIIGYRSESVSILLKENESKILNFQLHERTYQLETVEVTSDRPENWYDNLRTFKRLFIGQSDFAKQCIIENEEVLNFSTGTGNMLYAKADKPLKIINNALGYRLEISLVYFKWDVWEGRVRYSIKPKFTELEPRNEKQKKEWNKNRDYAYYGSLNHFLRSLKKNEYSNEGYELFFVDDLDKYDYNPLLHSEPIFTSDLLIKDGMLRNEHILNYDNYLEVKYFRKDSREEEISLLELNMSEVTIDRFGYPEEFMPFLTIGHWSKQGIADRLPKYYNAYQLIN